MLSGWPLISGIIVGKIIRPSLYLSAPSAADDEILSKRHVNIKRQLGFWRQASEIHQLLRSRMKCKIDYGDMPRDQHRSLSMLQCLASLMCEAATCHRHGIIEALSVRRLNKRIGAMTIEPRAIAIISAIVTRAEASPRLVFLVN